MDALKTGGLIKKLRLEKALTQKELSLLLGVEAKTVSKWETGKGLPDVSLFPSLSKYLGVPNEVFFSGDMTPSHENEDFSIKFYHCPSCKSFYTGFGNAKLTCCHKALSPLSPKSGTSGDMQNHIKDRDHYIAYTASVMPDSVTVRRYSPGDKPEPDIDGAEFFYLCTKHSLFKVQEEKSAKKETPGTNLTALISAFARAYCRNEGVFSDPYARLLFSDGEYAKLSSLMPDESYILHNLAPNPLFRARLAAEAAKADILTGTSQAVLVGAGLDTFSLQSENKPLRIFELDKKEVLKDKAARLKRTSLTLPDSVTFVSSDLSDLAGDLIKSGFDPKKKTLFSCLGLFYYFTKDEIEAFFRQVASFACSKSSVIFDFPDSHFFSSDDPAVRETVRLAAQSGNRMQCALSYFELEKLLSDSGFLIYEFLTPDDISARCFSGTRLSGIPHVNFCRAVLSRR